MTDLCSNGHTRTPDNTALHRNGRSRCKDCKREANHRARGGLKGAHPLIERSKALTRGRLEDIEDLVGFGATFQEVFQRSGYTQPSDMYRALRNADKHDVLDTLRKRR